MRKNRFMKIFNKTAGWLIPAIVLILWGLLSYAGVITKNILPSPVKVVKTTIEMLESGELFQYTLVSTKRAVVGLLIGGGIGFCLGLANGLSRISQMLLNNTVQMIRNIPILALLPLIILWFGIGEEAKVVMIAIGVFFPVYLNTYHGIKSIDPGLLEMGKVYGMNGAALFKDIVFPGALQSILVGIRYALGVMWLILIAAETVAADAGIGYMAMTARELMQMDVVLLCVFIYALLGKLSDVIATILEKCLLSWNPVFKKS